MLSILLVVYTAAIIFLYIYIRVVRRALNLLRASFSPIFLHFSALNVNCTRFFFFGISIFRNLCMYMYMHVDVCELGTLGCVGRVG